MSGELEVRRDVVDGWVPILAEVGELANRIANTDFVPKGLRGSVAGTAAAILSGRELGLGPMTALQNIYVADGSIGMKAALMRALVLAAGHEIVFEETTATRCVMLGKRAGSAAAYTRVIWTIEEARASGLIKPNSGWTKTPTDMLIARATGRLCRMIFADVIAGMPYAAEELADATLDGQGVTVQETARPQKPRTAQRKTIPAKETSQPANAAPAQPGRHDGPLPPLPGEDESEPSTPPRENPQPQVEKQGGPGVEGQTSGQVGAEADIRRPDLPGPDAPRSKEQSDKLHAVLGQLGVIERAEKLHVLTQILAKPIGSSADLTRAEASTVIDTLENLADQPDPTGALIAVLATIPHTPTVDELEEPP